MRSYHHRRGCAYGLAKEERAVQRTEVLAQVNGTSYAADVWLYAPPSAHRKQRDHLRHFTALRDMWSEGRTRLAATTQKMRYAKRRDDDLMIM